MGGGGGKQRSNFLGRMLDPLQLSGPNTEIKDLVDPGGVFGDNGVYNEGGILGKPLDQPAPAPEPEAVLEVDFSVLDADNNVPTAATTKKSTLLTEEDEANTTKSLLSD